ncbi:MAG TPA: hypothetical protein VEH06_07500 [Candidatus Bathyarchaeia archaeon]|nr:hypothetical protein [Candidatus Bathyarchaeia archaeon]
MIDKELPKILDQNMMVEDGESHSLNAIVNRIEGNQKVWDAEIKETFRCLQDMDVKIKEIVRVLLKPGSL